MHRALEMPCIEESSANTHQQPAPQESECTQNAIKAQGQVRGGGGAGSLIDRIRREKLLDIDVPEALQGAVEMLQVTGSHLWAWFNIQYSVLIIHSFMSIHLIFGRVSFTISIRYST